MIATLVVLLVLRSGWVHHISPDADQKLFAADAVSARPDGRQAAYTTSQTLMVYDFATREHRKLATDAGQPAWSPRGNWIAFESGHGAVDLVRPDGTGRRTLLAQSFVFGLAWHPGGDSVLFHDNQTLRRVSSDGKAISAIPLVRITGAANAVTSTDCFIPSPIAPEQLLYTRSVPGTALFDSIFHEPNTALFLYNPTTKTSKRLSPRELLVNDPVWSQDGQQVYFSGYYDRSGKQKNPFHIWRMDLRSGKIEDLGPGERVLPSR